MWFDCVKVVTSSIQVQWDITEFYWTLLGFTGNGLAVLGRSVVLPSFCFYRVFFCHCCRTWWWARRSSPTSTTSRASTRRAASTSSTSRCATVSPPATTSTATTSLRCLCLFVFLETTAFKRPFPILFSSLQSSLYRVLRIAESETEYGWLFRTCYLVLPSF